MKTGLPVDFDWLIGLLTEKCGVSGSNVKATGYDFEEIGDSKGYLSRVYRVAIQWEEENCKALPRSIILKIPTEDKIKNLDESLADDMFDDSTLLEAHNRECYFYRYMAMTPHPPIPMAKCYFAQQRVRNGDNGMLVLEDLSDGRALFYRETINLDQFKVFASHIASLQAHGFNHKDTTGLIRPTGNNVLMNMMLDEQLETGLDALLVEFGDIFPWSKDDFLQHVHEQTMKIKLIGDPTTTGHTPVLSLGDLQPNNVFWCTDPANNAKVTNKVRAFMDFQLSHIGYCMMDFSCPVAFCMSTELRRESLDSIIDHYLAELGQKIEGGVCPIKKEEAMFLCKRLAFGFAVLGVSVYTVWFAEICKAEGEEVKRKWVERMIAVLEDYW